MKDLVSNFPLQVCLERQIWRNQTVIIFFFHQRLKDHSTVVHKHTSEPCCCTESYTHTILLHKHTPERQSAAEHNPQQMHFCKF